MANLRTYLLLSSILLPGLLCTSLRAQAVQSDLGEDAQAIIDAPAVPLQDQPAIPDTIAIPRFEETAPVAAQPVIVAQPMIADDVEAVEIPTELIGEEEAEEDDEVEMAEDATLQEEVDEKDSTIKIMKGVTPGRAPLTASALRARSKPEPQAKLGTDVMTRTEARPFTFKVPAPRGQMLDRNGYPLAQSKVSYYASISFPFLGKEVEDAEVLRYAGERILHVNNILGSEWDLPGKIVLQHYKERRWFPLTFSSVLTDEEVDELNRQQMEGLKLHPVYVRHYPQEDALAHVIGYVGKRPPRTTGPIVNDEPLWGQGVGVDGLEEAFETDLRGRDGRVNVLFNQDGTKIKEDILANPKPGFNVVTAI
ncbi:MAG: hypothetical protein P1U58_21035, partial [Verrucomicrobiales bacterium]|nr:hypothetical protein [Verrucomicrobiales bacterium]